MGATLDEVRMSRKIKGSFADVRNALNRYECVQCGVRFPADRRRKYCSSACSYAFLRLLRSMQGKRGEVGG